MGRGPLIRRLLLRAARPVVAMAALGGAIFSVADSGDVPASALTAGPYTTAATGPEAFSSMAVPLTREQRESWTLGKEKFNEAWVVAPAAGGVWGLGPTFNEDRCAHCHVDNGRARSTADGGEAELGVLVRLSVPGTTREGGPLPHERYGDQLQNRGIEGRVPPEGRAVVRYANLEVELADGERVSLRIPRVEFEGLNFGDIESGTMTSLRVAPALVGLGLLEAIPESAILARAARQSELGLRGTPNFVWDFDSGKTVLGRFGWKASQPNLRQQVAAAFIGDIGATSYLFPEENCPAAQTQCRNVPSAAKCGGQGGCTGNDYRPEVQPSRLNSITQYVQSLAVPARRSVDDPEVKLGEAVFERLGCPACHAPSMETGAHPGLPAAQGIAIHAYTDLLLHDMGEGLADGRPDYRADGRQWRTAPLWGLGLLRAVSGHEDLLHDGRARGVVEAVLWHGGEAETSRERFRALPRADRAALVRFVESL